MKTITLCGDDCAKCPRYLARTDAQLQQTAQLWYRVGWRDRIVTNDEIRCGGCASHKTCTYGIVDCVAAHGVEKCSACEAFPCETIDRMLARSAEAQARCRAVCTDAEYEMLDAAFFHKEENLKK